MIKQAAWAALAMAALCGTALSEPGPEDFASGIPLSLEGRGALYECSVPDAVYETVVSTKYNDIRVFNGGDEVVPHALLKSPLPEPQVSESTVHKSGALPFFPVFKEESLKAGPVSLHIQTSDAGAIVDVAQGSASDPASLVDYYLVDASALDWTPNNLRLEWTPKGAGFLQKIDVSCGDDLFRWRRVTHQAAIADLNFGEHALVRDSAALSGASGRYLKIQWPEELKDVRLTRVEAENRRTAVRAASEPERRVQSIQGGRGESREYLFDAGGLFPADRLNLILPQPNTLARAGLYCRDRVDDPWERIFQGLLYNLSVGGASLFNESIAAPSSPKRHWRLLVDSHGGGLGEGMPHLELSYTSHRLCFAARGEGPFFLAFGSRHVREGPAMMDPLLSGLSYEKRTGLMKTAAPGEPYTLAGPRAIEEAQPPWPWRKILLWAVLGLGVLSVGVMAARLFRQVDGSGGESPGAGRPDN